MTKLGLVWMPRNSREAVDIAAAADAAGFDALGICDSPVLYEDVYPATTACLLATERLRVGPNVTNPVTRHWTVHAASLRAHHRLAPGRAMLGIGPGDGAVFSVGLAPAGNTELEAAVRDISQAAQGCGEIQVAAGGRRRARVAGRVGDSVILGTGLDRDALAGLGAAADAGRSSMTGADRARVARWGLVHLHLVEDDEEVAAAEAITKPLAIAYARHAFSLTFDGKNVPAAYQAPLSARLSRYEFTTHAAPGPANPNGRLLADHVELERYVLERFALVGTAEACSVRLRTVARDAQLDGVWLIIVVDDPATQVQRAASAFAELLRPGVTEPPSTLA